MEQWPVEEFTYIDTAACAWTSYAERKALRDVYWRRCEPLWVDGPGCEGFADFIPRVRHFEKALCVRDADKNVVVISLVMHALLWLRQHTSRQVTGSEMAAFDSFLRSVPNCAVLWSTSDRSGRLRLRQWVHELLPHWLSESWTFGRPVPFRPVPSLPPLDDPLLKSRTCGRYVRLATTSKTVAKVTFGNPTARSFSASITNGCAA